MQGGHEYGGDGLVIGWPGWYAQEHSGLPSDGVSVLMVGVTGGGWPKRSDGRVRIVEARAILGECGSLRGCSEQLADGRSLALWQRRGYADTWWTGWLCACGWCWHRKDWPHIGLGGTVAELEEAASRFDVSHRLDEYRLAG